MHGIVVRGAKRSFAVPIGEAGLRSTKGEAELRGTREGMRLREGSFW